MFIELVLIHVLTHTQLISIELFETGFSKQRYQHVSICAHISERQIMIKCVWCLSLSLCVCLSIGCAYKLEREGEKKFDDTCSSHHHHHQYIDDN